MTENKLIQPNIFVPKKPKIGIYSCFFTQIGTDDPIVTVLQNTLGEIIWNRTNVGIYLANSNGLFTLGKTVIYPHGTTGTTDPAGVPQGIRIPLSRSATTGAVEIYPIDVNNVCVQVWGSVTSGTLREWSTIGATPPTMSIKIEVYQN